MFKVATNIPTNQSKINLKKDSQILKLTGLYSPTKWENKIYLNCSNNSTLHCSVLFIFLNSNRKNSIYLMDIKIDPDE